MSAANVSRGTASGWVPERVGWKGIDQDTLDEAGVEDLLEQGVVVPYRLPDGSFVYSKRIGVNGNSWYEPSPLDVGGLIPFGLDAIPWSSIRDNSILLVAEGESDALTLRQHVAEIDGRRTYCLGLPGATSWRESWLSFLRPFSAVYVIPDQDEAGNRMAARVQQDCRWARIVELPEGDDVRAFVQREGAKALLPLLDEASWLLQLSLGFRVCRTLVELEAWMRRPMK